MKKQIFKSVAMPSRLFKAPLALAAANIGVHLPMITLASFNPLWLIISLLIVHAGLIIAGIKEPHLSNLLKIKNRKAEILCEKYDYDNSTILFEDKTLACVFKMNENRFSFKNKEKYMENICGMNLRLFYFKNDLYLIISGPQHPKLNITSIVQETLSSFPCELLTNASDTTAADIFKAILNPVDENVFFADLTLNKKSLLTNNRTQVQKDIMCFEQNGRKVYTSVLALSCFDDMADFEFINRLPDANVSILSYFNPLLYVKLMMMLEQRRRMENLTLKNSSAQRQYVQSMEMAENGDIFCFYGVNIYVSASSVQELENKRQQIIKNAKLYGLHFVVEKWNLPLTFYYGFPQYELPRRFLLPLSVLFE